MWVMGNWFCLVILPLGIPQSLNSRRPWLLPWVACTQAKVDRDPAERSVASCRAGRSAAPEPELQPIDSPQVARNWLCLVFFFAPLARCSELPVLELTPECFAAQSYCTPPIQGRVAVIETKML